MRSAAAPSLACVIAALVGGCQALIGLDEVSRLADDGGPDGSGHPAGSLDETFGEGGMVTLEVATILDSAAAVALQPDGKIVVGGMVLEEASQYAFVARLLENGSLDPEFAGGSPWISVTGPGDVGQSLHDVVLEPDGHILVVGASNYQLAITRLTTGGTADASYSFDQATVSDDCTTSTGYEAIVLDEAKLLVAGNCWVDDSDHASVFSVVTSANAAQVDALAISSENATAGLAMVRQADGAPIVLGNADISSMFAMRVTTSLAPDPTFGPGGSWSFTLDRGSGCGGTLAANGDLLLIGTDDVTSDYVIARTRGVNGQSYTVDTTFGTAGYARASFQGTDRSVLEDAEVAGDGSIIAVGWSYATTHGAAGIVRYSSEGALDSSFGTGGTVTFGGVDDGPRYQMHAMALTSDGRIVAVGWRSGAGALVVRLWN